MKKVGLQNRFFIASGRLDFLEKKFEIYSVTGNSIRSTGNSIRSQEIVFGQVPNLLLSILHRRRKKRKKEKNT